MVEVLESELDQLVVALGMDHLVLGWVQLVMVFCQVLMDLLASLDLAQDQQ